MYGYSTIRADRVVFTVVKWLLCVFAQAYRDYTREHGEQARLPGLDLSHDQLFFLAFAQVSLQPIREELT